MRTIAMSTASPTFPLTVLHAERPVSASAPPLPLSVQASEPLASFFTHLASLPASHPRRIGLLLMQIGVATALAALCLGLAVMHLAYGLAAVGALLARPPLHRLPGFWCAAAFAAWQVFSVLTVLALHRHPHPLGGLGMMDSWIALYLAQVGFADARVRMWACRALLATAAAAVVVALLQFTIGLGGRPPFHIAAPPLGERFQHSTGFAPVHLTLAFTMAMVALVFLHLPTVDTAAGRVRRWCGLTLACVGLLAANARSAFLAAAAGVGAGLVAGRGWRGLVIGSAAALVLVAAFSAYTWLLAPVHILEVARGDDGRLAIWRTTASLIADAPLLGTGGPEAYKDAYRARYPELALHDASGTAKEAPDAHNSHLAIAAEHGIPAALLHAAWIATLLLAAFRTRRSQPQRWAMAAALITTYLVAGQFENLAGHTATSYVFCTTLGLCLAAGRTEPRTPHPGSVSTTAG